VTGTVTIPTGNNYTIDSLTSALQNGINNLMGSSDNGMTPASVSGVTVKYDSTTNSLQFTTGTQGSSSYIKVSGDAQWGLTNLTTAYGTTSTWIKPVAATDSSGATVYINNTGQQTTSATGFTNVPEWSPVYLKEGELTFNTTGNLVSPSQGTKLSTVYLPNGKGALTLNINYSKSTQNATPFAILSQSQDGAPEGGLVGVNIGDNGLVQASYSNGATQSLGKVVLVNFSNPAGLKQLGNTEWYASSQSGVAKYGEAGSAGYGTVQSGALENANVDLTTELVNLITEQRAFESNSKALQTDTQMTQNIIQIQ
jgi:flagellar hook-basal body protein